MKEKRNLEDEDGGFTSIQPPSRGRPDRIRSTTTRPRAGSNNRHTTAPKLGMFASMGPPSVGAKSSLSRPRIKRGANQNVTDGTQPPMQHQPPPELGVFSSVGPPSDTTSVQSRQEATNSNVETWRTTTPQLGVFSSVGPPSETTSVQSYAEAINSDGEHRPSTRPQLGVFSSVDPPSETSTVESQSVQSRSEARGSNNRSSRYHEEATRPTTHDNRWRASAPRPGVFSSVAPPNVTSEDESISVHTEVNNNNEHTNHQHQGGVASAATSHYWPTGKARIPAASGGDPTSTPIVVGAFAVSGNTIMQRTPYGMPSPHGDIATTVIDDLAHSVATPPSEPTPTNVGAFAVRGNTSVQRTPYGESGGEVGTVSDDLASSAATSSVVSPSVASSGNNNDNRYGELVVPARIAEAQVQQEIRRSLAQQSGLGIGNEIDARVRQILAETTVPADNLMPIEEGDDEENLPPVVEEEAPRAIVSEEEKENEKLQKHLCKRNGLIAVSLLVLVGTVIGVAVPLASSGGGNDTPSPPSSTPPGGGGSEQTTLAPVVPPPSWKQLGEDIDGPVEASSFFGRSVSLSKDGSVVASGAPGTANATGQVRVLRYNTVSSSWNQWGQELVGDTPSASLGWTVSLSGAGDIVAVGADKRKNGFAFNAGLVRVYQLDTTSTSWRPKGQNIFGDAEGDLFGSVLSLSSDGAVFAAGAIGASPAYVRVHRYDVALSEWTKIGQDIVSNVSIGLDGFSVSLNQDGRFLAVGTDENPAGGKGLVRVYEYNEFSDVWTRRGQDILGDTSGDRFGFSVSTSDDGTVLAVGATSPTSSGYVRVYQFDSSEWRQRGLIISGEERGDEFGTSVSLSESGASLAVGGRSNPPNEFNGHVRVFDYDTVTSMWTQIGEDIDGEALGDQSGESVSLSGNADVVAIGAPRNDGSGANDSGHVRVYRISRSSQ